MRKINLNELKELQIEILKYTTNFCEKNQIKYFLDSGTLLGAIRHNGYIPWDDDIDIGMLREDYDRFLKLFNENNSPYKVYSVENNKNFFYPFAKVLDTNTILFEPDEKGIKLNVNIDVFVYDNAPENEKKLKKMYDRRDFYSYLNRIRAFHSLKSNSSCISTLIKHFLYPFLLLFPKNFFAKKMVKNSKMYCSKSTNYVGNFTSVSRIKGKKDCFSSFIDVKFEGDKYKAPIGYDEWLSEFYGNYMELPPVEKRVSHHSFVAYKED